MQNGFSELSLTELVNRWNEAKLLRDKYAAEEKLLRNAVIQRTPIDEMPKNTTAKYQRTMNDGRVLKLDRRVYFKFKKDFDHVAQQLIPIPEGVRRKVVKWTPTLVKEHYNMLSEEHRLIFDSVLDKTPASVTVEVTGTS